MKNFIHHQNYGTEKRNVQLKIDEVFAEKVIPADDSVRLLDQIMEEMDYTALLRAYKRTGRPPATNPVPMMKVLMYAQHGRTTLQAVGLHRPAARDINYIWLFKWAKKAPNHSEIAEGFGANG